MSKTVEPRRSNLPNGRDPTNVTKLDVSVKIVQTGIDAVKTRYPFWFSASITDEAIVDVQLVVVAVGSGRESQDRKNCWLSSHVAGYDWIFGLTFLRVAFSKTPSTASDTKSSLGLYDGEGAETSFYDISLLNMIDIRLWLSRKLSFELEQTVGWTLINDDHGSVAALYFQ